MAFFFLLHRKTQVNKLTAEGEDVGLNAAVVHVALFIFKVRLHHYNNLIILIILG